MHRVYEAADLLEAHHVANLLRAAGIDAAIFNENACGAAGELPLTVRPEIWISRDADLSRAQELIKEYEGASAQGLERVCSRCGQSSPANFTTCWHCGGALDHAQ